MSLGSSLAQGAKGTIEALSQQQITEVTPFKNAVVLLCAGLFVLGLLAYIVHWILTMLTKDSD